jgi:ammonia channel protein AmtB
VLLCSVEIRTFVFAIAWLSFNMSGTLGLSNGREDLSGRIAAVTMAGWAFGSMAGMFHSYLVSAGTVIRTEHGSIGCLAGLVSITTACATIDVWEGALAAFVGGLLACCAATLLEHLCIDDPVSAVPVHFVGGAWGLLVVGLFDRGPEYGPSALAGVLHGGGGGLFAVQTLGTLSIIAWGTASTALIVVLVELFFGVRVSLKAELDGLDRSEHGVGDSAEIRSKRAAASRQRLLEVLRERSLRKNGSQRTPSYLNDDDLDASRHGGGPTPDGSKHGSEKYISSTPTQRDVEDGLAASSTRKKSFNYGATGAVYG